MVSCPLGQSRLNVVQRYQCASAFSCSLLESYTNEGAERMKITQFGIYVIAIWATVVVRISDAQSDGDVVVVDVQRVVNESIIGKAARKNVEVLVSESKVKLAALKAELDRRTADLEKQRAILSKSALEERAAALEKQQREMQRKYQDFQEDIGRRNSEELSKVVKEVSSTVEEIAKAEKYIAVLEKDQRVVVYYSSRLDITDRVIKTLDKKKIAL